MLLSLSMTIIIGTSYMLEALHCLKFVYSRRTLKKDDDSPTFSVVWLAVRLSQRQSPKLWDFVVAAILQIVLDDVEASDR